MSEKDPAIEIIKLYLRTRGYDPSRAEAGIQDGHWILATIDQLCSVCCRDTYKTGMRHVLDILESGQYNRGARASDWHPLSSARILKLVKMNS